MMFYPPQSRLSEARRVLQPGGNKLVFNVWDRLDESPGHNGCQPVAGLFPDARPALHRLPWGYHDTGGSTGRPLGRL